MGSWKVRALIGNETPGIPVLHSVRALLKSSLLVSSSHTCFCSILAEWIHWPDSFADTSDRKWFFFAPTRPWLTPFVGSNSITNCQSPAHSVIVCLRRVQPESDMESRDDWGKEGKKGARYNITHGNVLWCHSRADGRSDGAVTLRDDALTRLYRTNRRRNPYTSGTSVANGTLCEACPHERRRNLEGAGGLRQYD